LLLIALGGGFYFGTGQKSVTALIPAFFGLAFVLLGLLGRNDRLRKHVMHAAAALGLVGLIVPLVRLLPKLSELELDNPAVLEQVLMAVVCAVFVVLCVRSFVVARLRRGQ
jgi:hypothetical protein